jgi:Zn-dependent peptidase ImmA (M78 family)
LDKNYLIPKNECKRRFALAHEAGHVILDTVLCGTKAQAAFKTEFNTDRFYTFAELRKILSAREYQANLAASALLMPKESVISFLKKHIASDKIYVYGENILSNFSKEIIEALAKHLKVSYSAIYIRLKQLNLFEYKSMDEYVNIDVYCEEEIL